MRTRKLAVVAALVAAVTGVVAGTSAAAPRTADDATINFTAHATDTQSIIETDGGSLVVDNGQFEVKGPDGGVLATTALKFQLDDFEFPIAAEIAGRTATLTPQFDREHAVYKPVALPYEDKAPWKNEYDREVAAWTRLTSTISAGATIGTLVGGVAGGAVGCVLGGIAGATVASSIILGLFGGFLPAAAVGCLGGIIAIGALGTLAGQLLVTAPVAVAAAIQYFTTINQPFVAPAK